MSSTQTGFQHPPCQRRHSFARLMEGRYVDRKREQAASGAATLQQLREAIRNKVGEEAWKTF